LWRVLLRVKCLIINVCYGVTAFPNPKVCQGVKDHGFGELIAENLEGGRILAMFSGFCQFPCP